MEDTLSLGLTMTALGMGTVFLVLAILAVVIALTNRFFERGRDNPAEDSAPVSSQVPEPETSLAGNKEKPGFGEVSPQVIAAIAAAIAAATGQPTSRFKLTTVRKAQDRGQIAWRASGREKIIGTRQGSYERKWSK